MEPTLILSAESETRVAAVKHAMALISCSYRLSSCRGRAYSELP